jgi:DNA processing protein
MNADSAALRALLLLRTLPGVGDLRLTQLLDEHGGAAAALAAAPHAVPRAAATLQEPRIAGRVDRALDAIERLGISVLTPFDAAYPRRLRLLYDPPSVLFALGDLALADDASVAVIGARRATAYGRDAASLLAGGLARQGYCIISGLARGIDGAAHQAALDAEGRTIAVVGSGLDVAYPAENALLQQRIGAEGLLLSEFLPGEPPLPHHFPRRNRIIAALADGVLVVEAGPKSGAFGTVEHALDLGRDVMAVPGPIGRDSSAGTHALIRQGAALVTTVEDVVEVLRGVRRPDTPEGAPPGRELESWTHPRLPAGSDVADERAVRTGRKPLPLPSSTGLPLGRPPRQQGVPVEALPLRAPFRADPGDGPIREPRDTPHRGILRALAEGPSHVDDVAHEVHAPSAAVLAALLELELDGRVRQLPGMRFTLWTSPSSRR